MAARALTRRWLHAVGGALLGWLCLQALGLGVAQAASFTDERGVQVRLEGPPQRVVSLLPSLSETVCALGACARLVGVDRYSTYPTQLHKLPQVGGGLDPDIERIVALQPDLVLLAQSTRAAQRLEALGLKVFALEPKTYADVQRVTLLLGQLLQVPDAAAVWRTMQAEVAAAAQTVPARQAGAAVYLEVSDGPYAASTDSFIGQTLARLGAHSIVPGALGPFPLLNPEFVVRADPDIVIAPLHSAAALRARPGWATLRALRQQRQCWYTPEQADVLVRPGPRMGQAARMVAACLAQHAPLRATTATPPAPAARSSAPAASSPAPAATQGRP